MKNEELRQCPSCNAELVPGQEVCPNCAISKIAPMQSVIADAVEAPRSTAWLVGGFALLVNAFLLYTEGRPAQYALPSSEGAPAAAGH